MRVSAGREQVVPDTKRSDEKGGMMDEPTVWLGKRRLHTDSATDGRLRKAYCGKAAVGDETCMV